MADISLLEKLDSAYYEWVALNNHEAYPSGKSDNGGRWYPDPLERRACCAQIREPSRAWPWSLWHHCHTAKHVAYLYDLDPLALRRYITAKQKGEL
jgi:hypothetical protein